MNSAWNVCPVKESFALDRSSDADLRKVGQLLRIYSWGKADGEAFRESLIFVDESSPSCLVTVAIRSSDQH